MTATTSLKTQFSKIDPIKPLTPAQFKSCRTFAALSKPEKLSVVKTLNDQEAAILLYTWEAWARDSQLAPDWQWSIWIQLCGRGAGKTRSGAEWMRAQARKYSRLGLIGRTAADVRDVMIEGDSGILACSPKWERPIHKASKRQLEWPNGATATTYSAEEPDQLRGPQHFKLWMDEPGAWQFEDSFDQAMFGLRLGDNPQAMLTTTPRVTKLIKRVIAMPTTHVTRGTTYENKDNLPPSFFSQIINKYENTRLGRQELLAELLEDVEGALWNRDIIDELRCKREDVPDLVRTVVAIDPAVTAHEGSDETGIVVVGLGADGHGYVLEDCSMRGSPNAWATRAIHAYTKWDADRILAEVNNGGDLVENTLRTIDKHIPYKAVRATKGKYTRAEPVSSIYERKMAHHVGNFPDLEDQMVSWEPGVTKSPDRVDSLVWGFTELMVGTMHIGGMSMVTETEDHIPEDEMNEVEKKYAAFFGVGSQ